LTAGEQLFVNVGASQVGGRVLGVKGDLAKIALTAPACAQAKDKVALSRRIDKHWRLVGEYRVIQYLSVTWRTDDNLDTGWGEVVRGTLAEVQED
jgi:translation initiation factor 2 subunit 3